MLILVLSKTFAIVSLAKTQKHSPLDLLCICNIFSPVVVKNLSLGTNKCQVESDRGRGLHLCHLKNMSEEAHFFSSVHVILVLEVAKIGGWSAGGPINVIGKVVDVRIL